MKVKRGKALTKKEKEKEINLAKSIVKTTMD
jgi:hypothetical protein